MGAELELDFFCSIQTYLNAKRRSNGKKKKMPSLGLIPNLKMGSSLTSFFAPSELLSTFRRGKKNTKLEPAFKLGVGPKLSLFSP
jgi:hypothetical protein